MSEKLHHFYQHNLVFNKIEDKVITKKILDTLNLEKDLVNYYSDIKKYISEYSEENMIKIENLIRKLIIYNVVFYICELKKKLNLKKYFENLPKELSSYRF